MHFTDSTTSNAWRVSVLLALAGLALSATPAAATQPKIKVDKTASPASLPAPGGNFGFTVAITNTSKGGGASSAEITALVDDVYGDVSGKGSCTNAVGTILASGAVYSCSFTGSFNGSAGDKQTDTVTASVRDPASPGDTASASGKATVKLTDGAPPTCAGAVVTILGTAGRDTLIGTDGTDVISGLGGRDEISGGLGEDLICGGSGADVLRGSAGNDTIKAGGANDRVRGGSGDDALKGGSGDDRLGGGTGTDVCRGGPGRDRARSCETVRSVP